MAQENFWDDPQAATALIDTANEAKRTYQTFMDMEVYLEDLQVAFSLYEESSDPEMLQEARDLVDSLGQAIEGYQMKLLFSEDHDHQDAILEIHSGAGGTESQDWAAMLQRMYQRWGDQNDFKLELVDFQAGEEAGIKGVTYEVRGRDAYGYLKSERGVHRLVRLSPFDSNNRRHTSFCSVEVTPMIDHTIEVEVNEEDLRIDTYRASGAGGQHVNKTDSAVRITHEPTGIVVQSQSQRSQIHNRDQAMAMLKSKLYQLEAEEKAKELAALKGDQKDIAWGSQIRSYVFHPYNMVKDHRTHYEVGNIQGVMDGDLMPFMDAYLKWRVAED